MLIPIDTGILSAIPTVLIVAFTVLVGLSVAVGLDRVFSSRSAPNRVSVKQPTTGALAITLLREAKSFADAALVNAASVLDDAQMSRSTVHLMAAGTEVERAMTVIEYSLSLVAKSLSKKLQNKAGVDANALYTRLKTAKGALLSAAEAVDAAA